MGFPSLAAGKTTGAMLVLWEMDKFKACSDIQLAEPHVERATERIN